MQTIYYTDKNGRIKKTSSSLPIKSYRKPVEVKKEILVPVTEAKKYKRELPDGTVLEGETEVQVMTTEKVKEEVQATDKEGQPVFLKDGVTPKMKTVTKEIQVPKTEKKTVKKVINLNRGVTITKGYEEITEEEYNKRIEESTSEVKKKK